MQLDRSGNRPSRFSEPKKATHVALAATQGHAQSPSPPSPLWPLGRPAGSGLLQPKIAGTRLSGASGGGRVRRRKTDTAPAGSRVERAPDEGTRRRGHRDGRTDDRRAGAAASAAAATPTAGTSVAVHCLRALPTTLYIYQHCRRHSRQPPQNGPAMNVD